MSDVTFDEVLDLAKQLDPAERLLLARRLEASIPRSEFDLALRQALLTDHERLKTEGAFANADSLYGKFATQGEEWSEDELTEYLRDAGREWEEEMNELDDDSPNT